MSDMQKQIRARALRLRRLLRKEEALHGQIDDGAGKRYLIGPLFVQCGDIESALTHYVWFKQNCTDESGEPIHNLFWAVALHRAGDVSGANTKLLQTMIQNIYLLPILLNMQFEVRDIWHSSSREQPDYFAEAPPELVPTLSDKERSWITKQLESDRFRRVEAEYISTFSALKDEHNPQKRRGILDRWYEFQHLQLNIVG